MGYKEDEKRPGTWRVWYSKRHPITRQPKTLRRGGFKTKAEAIRAERQLVIDLEIKLRKTMLPSWPALVESYKKHMINSGLSLKTVDSYYLCLKKYTFKIWQDRLVDTIQTNEIRSLILNDAKDRSASHQKNILKFIRGAFNYALDEGIIQRNPAPRMKFSVGLKIKKILTKEELKKFLNKAKEYDVEWYPHWCLASYTGMRNGELYALTWDKVNFEDRNIIVDSSWNNKDGFKSTKSGEDRMLEIAPNLLQILKELKMSSVDNFVLPRIDKWDKGQQARELRMFLCGLVLPEIRFHDLRATWATVMLSSGIPPIKVQIMGGWKDLKTMQLYVRKAGVDIKGITNNLVLHDPNTNTGKLISIKV